MAVYIHPTTTGVRTPPIYGELRDVFSRLEDDPLIDGLIGLVRSGPKGHPPRVLWWCFITKHYLGLRSTAELIRVLGRNPFVAQACGIIAPEDIPHKSTFSRFFKRLSTPKFLPRVKDVSRALVRKHYGALPAFGDRTALDSSTLKAWSNGGKTVKSDPDAGWSVKKGTQGVKEYTYGYKLHLLVDCENELPIAANVSAGNVNDVKRASNVLSEARKTNSKFHPRFFMADKGYAAKFLFRLVRRQYRAKPIIDIPANRVHMLAREGTQGQEYLPLRRQRQAVERAVSGFEGGRS